MNTRNFKEIVEAAKTVIQYRNRYLNYTNGCYKCTVARTYRSQWRRAMNDFMELIYDYQDNTNTRLPKDPDYYVNLRPITIKGTTYYAE